MLNNENYIWKACKLKVWREREKKGEENIWACS